MHPRVGWVHVSCILLSWGHRATFPSTVSRIVEKIPLMFSPRSASWFDDLLLHIYQPAAKPALTLSP